MIEQKDFPPNEHDPEDIRTEYKMLSSYHQSLVNSRFTIAGLFVAATGFLIGAFVNNDISLINRMLISGFGCWLTLCIWVLELRSRSLFTNIAMRAVDIEHKHWNLVGHEWYSGLYNRQYKIPIEQTNNIDYLRRQNPDRPSFGWTKQPIPESISKYISHSIGFDLLYFGSETFWCISFVYSGLFLVFDIFVPVMSFFLKGLN